MHQEKYLYL